MLACLCFSEKGFLLSKKILEIFEGKIYYSQQLEKPIKNYMKEIWETNQTIIFISATGIAVRFIAPFVESKEKDPGVLVIDDTGKHVISLLSGHLGGANEFARILSKQINAEPIITTATDNRGIEGLDLYCERMGFKVRNIKDLTKFTSAMVNGKNIAVFNPYKFELPNYKKIVCFEEEALESTYGVLAISEHIKLKFQKPSLFLRPKLIHLGLGSRKNAKFKNLLKALQYLSEKFDFSLDSIADIGTIELKKNEPAIIELSNYLDCPIKIFTRDELKEVENIYKGSKFVESTVGVSSVSATSAHLLGGNMLCEKMIYEGFTLSITKEEL